MTYKVIRHADCYAVVNVASGIIIEKGFAGKTFAQMIANGYNVEVNITGVVGKETLVLAK